MHRVGGPRNYEEQIQYHLDDGRAPNFTIGQASRVELAKWLIDRILRKNLTERPLTFVELGCGAGDITGPYAEHRITVHGYDVTLGAERESRIRFPAMSFHLQAVEEVEPYACDLLVMTEFLEHVVDPLKIVSDWLPLAKWAIIGHPLNEPDPPIEPGHIWSYTLDDWNNWFRLGNHHIWERYLFPMSGWENMVLGHSCRNDQDAAAWGR